MARGRLLAKVIGEDRAVAALSDLAALLYTWTIAHLDRDGLVTGEAGLLRARVAPWRDWRLTEVEEAIQAWVGAGLVQTYEDGKNGRVLFFHSFRRHQMNMEYEREAPSTFGPPPGWVRTDNAEALIRFYSLPATKARQGGMVPVEMLEEIAVRDAGGQRTEGGGNTADGGRETEAPAVPAEAAMLTGEETLEGVVTIGRDLVASRSRPGRDFFDQVLEDQDKVQVEDQFPPPPTPASTPAASPVVVVGAGGVLDRAFELAGIQEREQCETGWRRQRGGEITPADVLAWHLYREAEDERLQRKGGGMGVGVIVVRMAAGGKPGREWYKRAEQELRRWEDEAWSSSAGDGDGAGGGNHDGALRRAEPTAAQQLWGLACGQLQLRMAAGQYAQLVEPLHVRGWEDGTLTLAGPGHVAELVRERWHELMLSVVRTVAPDVAALRVVEV